MRTASQVLGLALAMTAGCGGGGAAQEMPGIATVTFAKSGVFAGNLTLQTAAMRLARVQIAGDAPPPYTTMPPPELDLDLLGSGVATQLSGLDPGLYSVVQFEFHAVMVTGTWKGTAFTSHTEPPPGPGIILRAPAGEALGEGEDVTFAVDVDVGSWFANDLLDQAMVIGGQITCDDHDNQAISEQLGMRIAHSFTITP